MTVSNRLGLKHVLSVSQFDREKLQLICETADRMERIRTSQRKMSILRGYILANVFCEPSTRTDKSFEFAMKRLGGDVGSINDVHVSSFSKGEDLEDGLRSLEACSADIVALRHTEDDAAKRAAAVLSIPVINAGAGREEHPTQALLDVYTLVKERKTTSEVIHERIDGLTVTFVGDLKNGRTVRSKALLLSLFDVKMRFVSPPSIAMPESLRASLRERNVSFTEHESLEEVIRETDVLYVTRTQRERMDKAEYLKVQGSYVVDAQLMELAKPDMVLMHPLPRTGEIAKAVDQDPRAAYFRQIQNGLYVRMALLALLLDASV